MFHSFLMSCGSGSDVISPDKLTGKWQVQNINIFYSIKGEKPEVYD
jgi:hypothetical protein